LAFVSELGIAYEKSFVNLRTTFNGFYCCSYL